MTLIPELRSELAAMLERRARRRRRLLFGLTPIAVVATGGLALAASGALTNSAGPRAIGIAPSDADTGVVVSGTDRVLAVRADDPQGGPPWTLRLTRTGGAGCLTPERVGGATREPNPFGGCVPLDAGGRMFFGAASAVIADDACARKPTAACLGSGRQTALFGALGPDARSVTFESATGPKTVSTSGPEGAYLIVISQGAGVGGASRYPPDKVITAITFRDGRTCTRAQFDATACPLPGFRQPRLKLPTHEEVGARVTASARQGRRFWVLRVHFRARLAADGVSSGYAVRIFPPNSKRHRSATAAVRAPVRAGQEVEQVFQHLNGGGEYRIIVSYSRVTEPGQTPLGGPTAGTVGRFRLRIP